MQEQISIDGKKIGRGFEPYFIAEIGNNHNGDSALAKEMVDAAVSCGVDAVKFQSWTSDTLVAQSLRKSEESILPWEEIDRYQMTREMHFEISEYCNAKGVTFLSSAFTAEEIDLLVSLKVPALKISSGEIINIPLLEKAAETKLPVILSCGMATLAEIENAVVTLTSNGSRELVLLHCVSNYPPEPHETHLRYMHTLESAFGVPVGFSDHSLGTTIPLAAIAQGAVMIEKHFTTDNNLEGWDQAVSANPTVMRTIVEEGKKTLQALGSSSRKVTEREREKRKLLSRSIIVKKELKEGSILTHDDLDLKRPGIGISPDKLQLVIGRKLAKDKLEEETLFWEDLA